MEKVSERSYTLRNNRCPWGDTGSLNPVLCMLTRAIIARIGVRIHNTINVDILKTIAGEDDLCMIEVIFGQ